MTRHNFDRTLLRKAMVAWPLRWCLVLVSCGCCEKVPQTGWLQTREMYRLTGLEAGGPKSRCCEGHAPPDSCREHLLQALFLAPGGCRRSWMLLGCRHSTPASASRRSVFSLHFTSLCGSQSLCSLLFWWGHWLFWIRANPNDKQMASNRIYWSIWGSHLV